MKEKSDLMGIIIKWINSRWPKFVAWDGSNGLSVIDPTIYSIWIENRKTREVVLMINDFKLVVATGDVSWYWDLPHFADPKYFDVLDVCLKQTLN